MGFFDFLGTVIQTTIIATGVTIATAAGFAYATKPDELMLKKDIETSITSNSGNALEHLADKLMSKVATGTSSTVVKDYVVVKTADVTFADGTKQTYVGVFQNWYPINGRL